MSVCGLFFYARVYATRIVITRVTRNTRAGSIEMLQLLLVVVYYSITILLPVAGVFVK